MIRGGHIEESAHTDDKRISEVHLSALSPDMQVLSYMLNIFHSGA